MFAQQQDEQGQALPQVQGQVQVQAQAPAQAQVPQLKKAHFAAAQHAAAQHAYQRFLYEQQALAEQALAEQAVEWQMSTNALSLCLNNPLQLQNLRQLAHMQRMHLHQQIK